MTDLIRYEKSGGVATLAFNRPDKKNALTVAMYAKLAESLRDACADDAIRCVALLGGNDFTAGNDIMDFMAAGGFSEDMPVLQFLRELSTFPKPIVAGVTGVAIGIGTTMLLHCDAVVVATSAKLSLPFTKLGLVPEAAASLLLPLATGRMRASWLLLSGESFDGHAAVACGIANRACDDAEVHPTVQRMCEHLATLPPNAMRETKRLIKSSIAATTAATLKEEANSFAAALQGQEARDAFMAFMQRK